MQLEETIAQLKEACPAFVVESAVSRDSMVATHTCLKEELHESAYLGVEECRQILFCSQLGLHHWAQHMCKLSSSSQVFPSFFPNCAGH